MRPFTTLRPAGRLAAGDVDELRPDAQRGLSARREVAPLAGDGAERAVHHGEPALLAAHPAVDEVRPADEIRDEAVVRVEVDLLGRAELDDPPGAHHGDHVGEGQGLHAVVRDVDGGDLELLQEGAQLLARLLPQLGVEVAERLVEEDDARLGHQRPGQRHPLLLPAGELGRRAPLESRELHEIAAPWPRARAPPRAGRRAPAADSPRCRTPSCAARWRRSGTPCPARASPGERRCPSPGTTPASSPMLISPVSGISRPTMQRSSVVLPQPLGPSSVKIFRAGMVRFTSSRALMVLPSET